MTTQTLYSSPGFTVTLEDSQIVVESDSRGAGVYEFRPGDPASFAMAMRSASWELEFAVTDSKGQ